MDLKGLNKKRVAIDDVSASQDGEKVTIAGWVYDSRALGKLRFLLVRDISGEIQVTGFKGETTEEIFKSMDKTSRESVVVISGTVKKSSKAPGGREISPESFEVLAVAENPLPVDVSDFSKTELPKRLDFRFLDFHRRKTQAIFKINDTMLGAFREFMSKERSMEGVFPSIIGSSSEGGTELFSAKYFDKKAYLSQSCQLYKQMLACSVEKVHAIFTVWRAEKHNTLRHLNEARQFDFEMAFADEHVVMDVLARCVQYMVGQIIDKNKAELELLEVKLKVPKVKYFTFAEVSDLLKKNKSSVGKAELSGENEKKLGELFPDTIVMVYEWPIEGRTFYIMPRENGVSGGFDAIYNGMEITSGGQRIHLPDLLIERLKAKDLDPKDFKAYIDSFRYGAPPHAGWGLGVERLLMQILGIANIREVTMFPRDRDRLSP